MRRRTTAYRDPRVKKRWVYDDRNCEGEAAHPIWCGTNRAVAVGAIQGAGYAAAPITIAWVEEVAAVMTGPVSFCIFTVLFASECQAGTGG